MSREAELYKDKIEVSLDGRQIFYLFFGGAVIVGLVFVLGVMVGRRVEARGHTDRARVAATVDPLAALDRLEGGSGLSFQGALRGADGPISDVEKTIAAMPKRDDKAVAKLDKRPDEVKPVEPAAKVEEPKKVDEPAKKVEEPAKKVDESAKKVEEVKKVEEAKKVEPKKLDEAQKITKAADKPVDKPSDKLTDKASDKLTDKASDKLTDKAKPADAPSDKPADKPEEKKQKFMVQLSSFQDKTEAEAYLASVKSVGYNVHITEATVDGKQYYRVRTGSFRSIELATQAKAEIEKSTKKSAIVVKL